MNNFVKKNVMIKLLRMLIIILVPLNCMSATWTENEAYSISWYKKSATEFNISTAAEFAGIAYLVNNNLTDFAGQTINIDADINLGGRDWAPIGLGSKIFQGNINGNGHTIYNISITQLNSKSETGIWIKLNNSEIKNITLSGETNVTAYTIGFVAATANNSTFENVESNCKITYKRPEVGRNSSTTYELYVGGLVGVSKVCKYTNISSNCVMDYTFGSSTSDNCYRQVRITAGGIVGDASEDQINRCYAYNSAKFDIYGYITTNAYCEQGTGNVNFGGIAGEIFHTSIIGCLAENIDFTGKHPTGTFNKHYFSYGGVLGASWDSYSDSSSLKNCVAINKNYTISGHTPSWQADYYHTSSYFGGVVSTFLSENFAACYSNNDVKKNVSKVKDDTNSKKGSVSYSAQQMHTQSFVDELNFLSQMEYDEDFWTLKNGKLSLLPKSDNSSVPSVSVEGDVHSIYDVNGVYRGTSLEGLESGIYILRSKNKAKKIYLR